VLTSHGNDFSAISGAAQLVEARIVDDCGRPFTSGAAVLWTTTGESSALQSLGDGRWVGSWTASAPGALATAVTLSVTAQDLLGLVRGTFQTTGLAAPAGGTQPRVQEGGVVSGAGFERHRPLASGGFVSIFGEGFADRSAAASSLPLETVVAGSRVTLGLQSLPLAFLSANQINALVPFDVPTGRPLPLIVWRGDAPSVAETVVVARTSPDIFVAPQAGAARAQGAITDTSFRLVDASNPARPGDVIVIFCTGLGAVRPAVPAGAAAPANPVATVEASIQATAGGQNAEVLGAVLAPGFTGLYQVAVRLPASLTAAASLPVTLTADGATSAPVVIAVRGL
jgi:uncharacterized protein (TIGR03437 family)